MQINVLEYFEQGALANCRQKVAVADQDRQYTFAELERFAKNCAALILQRFVLSHRPGYQMAVRLMPTLSPRDGLPMVVSAR